MSSSATTSARAQTAIAAAGAVYVLAWIAGLLMAPAAPDPTASDGVVNSFFAENQAATLLQALTVHGVAGIALAVLVLSLARCLAGDRDDGTRIVFLVTGLGAAAVSLAQLAIEIALNRHVAGSGSAGTTASLFHAVNVADTVKLALLGIAIAAATRLAARAAALPRWLRTLGYVLIIGGLASIVDSDALTGLLTASLFLLLFGRAPSASSARDTSAARPDAPLLPTTDETRINRRAPALRVRASRRSRARARDEWPAGQAGHRPLGRLGLCQLAVEARHRASRPQWLDCRRSSQPRSGTQSSRTLWSARPRPRNRRGRSYKAFLGLYLTFKGFNMASPAFDGRRDTYGDADRAIAGS